MIQGLRDRLFWLWHNVLRLPCPICRKLDRLERES